LSFNGWLAIMGPGGTAGLVDRQLSQILSCTYVPYGSWTCPHCHGYLHSSALQSQLVAAVDHYRPTTVPVHWWHVPCTQHGPVTMDWDREPTITTVLYAYHAYCCNRPEAHDDVRKLLIMGKKVVVIAHDLAGLEHIAPYVYGIICPSIEADVALHELIAQAASTVRVTAVLPQPTPMVPPATITLPRVPAQHIIGWHGQWRPDRNVHALIAAVARLRQDGIDAGLLAQGALVQPGLRPLPSSLAYHDYCAQLVHDLNLTDYCLLFCPRRSHTGYACWADVHAALAQCTLFCLPTIPATPPAWWGQRSMAAHTCLFFRRPTVVTDCPFYSAALEGAIALTDLSPAGIAARLVEVITGTAIPPEHGDLTIRATHQPFAIQHRYLSTIRAWVA